MLTECCLLSSKQVLAFHKQITDSWWDAFKLQLADNLLGAIAFILWLDPELSFHKTRNAANFKFLKMLKYCAGITSKILNY